MSGAMEPARTAEISIILPVFNDAEWVANALTSCLAQTLTRVEVIVVDDASTDETVSIVERYQAIDDRIRLIRQSTNSSAFQARRVGIEASTAPYILLLDGDDELAPDAAESALAIARAEAADVVAFGCHVVKPDGSTGGAFETAMQPREKTLFGEEILESLFPVGKTAQGQVWRYLFQRDLLLGAYASLPSDLTLPRANDLPIAFLALMNARKYASTPARLYRYFFRRGASGHRLSTVDDYRFVAGAIDSIDVIRGAVDAEAATRPDGGRLRATWESARSSVIGRVLDYVWGMADDRLQQECLTLLLGRVGQLALIAACADFCAKALPLVASAFAPVALDGGDPRHILLRASNLGTGGAQGVVVAQASYLAQAGFTVTIAVDYAPDTHFRLPDGVRVVQITGASLAQKLRFFAEYCRARHVDVVIDHYVFYNDRWPFFALVATAEKIPVIGWLHNFALRPIVDGSTRLSFLDRYLPLLATVVVLSQADVAYWKLRGLPHVAYLPNPPSPMLEHFPSYDAARPAPAGVLEIVWWGRLQQATKQVRDLIDVAGILRELGIDFRLTIIGPDGPDLSADQLRELSIEKGVADSVVLPGPLHGEALAAAVESAHVFLSASVIEGYPLALVEAQAAGLPLVMYDLPWLATLRDHAGVIAVAQGDRRTAALALAKLATDPAAYEDLSRSAVASARQALSHNFESLYADLVRGRLAAVHSPAPTLEDVQLLLDQNVRFVERLVRRENRAVGRARAETRQARAETSEARAETSEARAEARRARREALRAGAEASRLEQILRKSASLEVKCAPHTTTPSVPRGGIKGWLQRLLPATMRQASFFARHQHITTTQQNDQIIANQLALSNHLRRIEASLDVPRGSSET